MLGSALAELLQAKMQLFGGARVLERMRLRSLVAAAGKAQSPADESAPDYLRIVPAEILVAGSVEVASGKETLKIKVRARVLETQTSNIISWNVIKSEKNGARPG